VGPLGVMREYLKMLAPFFIGRSIYDFEMVASHIRNKFYHFGTQGHFVSCLGGINVASYDAIGKTLGVSVCDLLGGRAGERVACYATTGYFTDDPKVGIEEQLSVLAPGAFVGVKIKIGAGIASDLERVKAARRVIGDKTLLMVDMNGNYTVDVALESLRRLAPFDIHWCEEPLPPTDIAGYAELRSRSPVPLAAGEGHHGVQDFKRLIEARAIDIVQPSITGSGGLGELKAIATLAQAYNLRVSPPCWGSAIALAAAVHFTASLPAWPHTDHAPYPMMVEYDVAENPLRDRLVRDPLRPQDAKLPVPSGPGLGLTLDPDTVARYKV
jgi:D-galactarolactone cycloisomerase